MGKKEKTKGKLKSSAAADDGGRRTSGDAIPEEMDDGGVAATNGIGGWGPAATGEHMDRFGADGWGEGANEEHQPLHWLPPDNGGTWDNPAPDIGAWIDNTVDEVPGLMGSGAKKHPSAAVRMSLASQANNPQMTPDVQDLLTRMQMATTNGNSPKRAPTEISVNRSSAAFSHNPVRSHLPTRSNSISGSHSAPNTSAYPSFPASTNLQQTRFFNTRPAQPLSTIHSDRSIHTFAEQGTKERPTSRQWLPPTSEAEVPMHHAQSAFSMSAEPVGYMLDQEFNAEEIGLHGQEAIISFQESGGEALRPANKALFKSQRPADERIRWGLYSDQDDSVSMLLDWIEDMRHGLAQLALHKYIESKTKGALITNAQYRPARTPDEPAFDWITFEQARGTLDRRFQEGIAHYDPSTTFVVYVFLLSDTGNSLGIWKKKLAIPLELQDYYAKDLERVNAHVRKKQYVVAVEELPPGARTPRAPGIRHSTKPAQVTRFSAAAQPPTRSRTTSAPSPAGKKVLTKDQPPEKEKKRSTWSKIFGGKK